ncbi:MAG: transporter substrate-binding protein, partial [Chloroflexi bacterium]|nr:transporter substrate-binding protein [Chloroflexota bacterium]
AAGYVESLARPGGNVTGVVGPPVEIDLKRLQLLVEAVPGVSMVAVLGVFGGPRFWEPATRLLAVEVFSATPVGFEGGFETALARAIGRGADALLARGGQGTAPNAELIGALSARYRLPGIFPNRRFVEAGGLIAYAPRSSDVDRRGADYVDRILRGARPADLPVELPARYDLIVNMRTARELGIRFPQSFFAQVDEVIE